MARLLNLAIVILEIIAFAKVRKRGGGLKKGLTFYTIISNLIACAASLLLVIFGQRAFVEVARFTATGMLAMTFFVTACILVPLSGRVKELLFSGSGLFHHLLIPVLSTVSYIFAEDRAPIAWVWVPVIITLIYGLTMLYLNATGKVDGPYPFFRVNKLGAVKTTAWMVVLIMAVSALSGAVGYKRPVQSDVKYIFVHGLSGWGSYDAINEFIPYWGLTGGSVVRYLNNRGYESYAASVDPTGSAWDRACELYAQLTGTRVDYGEAHSRAAGHERFGRDFTGHALLDDFGTSKFALIGHSFGGATIRVFSEILRDGSAEERAVTDEADLSPYFKGGNGDKLFALVTLAAPTNGTTAYDLYEDASFDTTTVKVDEKYEKTSGAVSRGTKVVPDGRASWDYASYDMHIDNALALNERITTFNDVYYFAYPCSSSIVNADGSVSPDPSITESIFMKGAEIMSKYTGVTKGGTQIGPAWQSNDGLVNEISAGAPLGAPQVKYSDGTVFEPGRWHVMPTFRGDHMAFQGGLTKRINIKPFYLELAKMISEL